MCESYIPYLLGQRKEMQFIWEQADSVPLPSQEGKCPTICAGRNLPKQGLVLCPTTGAGCRWKVLSPFVGPDLGSLWPFPSLYALESKSPFFLLAERNPLSLVCQIFKFFYVFSNDVLSSGEEKKKNTNNSHKAGFSKSVPADLALTLAGMQIMPGWGWDAGGHCVGWHCLPFPMFIPLPALGICPLSKPPHSELHGAGMGFAACHNSS